MPFIEPPTVEYRVGHVHDELDKVPDEYFHCSVFSSPYWGARGYAGEQTALFDVAPDCPHDWVQDGLPGTKNAIQGSDNGTRGGTVIQKEGIVGVRGQPGFTCRLCGGWRGALGSEPTPELFVKHLTNIVLKIARKVRKDGTIWLNIGGCYFGGNGFAGDSETSLDRKDGKRARIDTRWRAHAPGWKAKDYVYIPWLVGIALREAGLWLRSPVIWCLSGGTYLYVKTPNFEGPMSIHDMVRYPSNTPIQLWTGMAWTPIVGWKENPRIRPLEIVLRSGEKIQSSENHRWPTHRGLVATTDLVVGDVISSCGLPEPVRPAAPAYLPDEEIGWFVGLYIAEGSHSTAGAGLTLAAHAKEESRFERMRKIVEALGGYCKRYIYGNTSHDDTHGLVVDAVIDQYVLGMTSKDKHLSIAAWKRSNIFLKAVLDGYLEGNGHWEPENNRWRIGFTRNPYLAIDLRTICARLGYTITLKAAFATAAGRRYQTYRGEIRFSRTGHWSERDRHEVVSIRNSNGRKFYDIETRDEPHLFALASGILTHNSKVNRYPEPVKDRPCIGHEYVLLFSKSPTYFYDYENVREPAKTDEWPGVGPKHGAARSRGEAHKDMKSHVGRSRGTVWHIATHGYHGTHVAPFPEELVEICLKAGTSDWGACATCGAPWRRLVREERPEDWRDEGPTTGKQKAQRASAQAVYGAAGNQKTRNPSDIYGRALATNRWTVGWEPACGCHGKPEEWTGPCANCGGTGTAKATRWDMDIGEIVAEDGECEPCDGSGEVDHHEWPDPKVLEDWPRKPCRVLDPFAGSGTTLRVARRMGRSSVGIDISDVYEKEARSRSNHQTAPLEDAPDG